MKIIHLSDLHFGTESPQLTEILTQNVKDMSPNLIVVSGDFAQIASKKEFLQAEEFISQFDCPVFCVPGNHDISHYNILERLFAPFKSYRKYITQELNPYMELEDVCLQGLNSARAVLPHWNWANGAVSDKQIALLKALFQERTGLGICVLHHPVHKAEEPTIPVKVFGSKKLLKALDGMNVDIVLTGHVHHPSAQKIGSTIFISASTALSSRKRGHENGFNVLNIEDNMLLVEHVTYDGMEGFVKETEKRFKLRESLGSKQKHQNS